MKTRDAILAYIVSRRDAGMPPPTRSEIRESVGLASPTSVDYHLHNLEDDGLVNHDPTIVRGITLTAVSKDGAYRNDIWERLTTEDETQRIDALVAWKGW